MPEERRKDRKEGMSEARSIRTSDEILYNKVICLLASYFTEPGWEKLFLSGGCYWLANFLHQQLRSSKLMINRAQEHCAIAFGIGIYDVTGRISHNGFHEANSREVSFMKKNYIPCFPADQLERYLKKSLSSDIPL